MPDRHELTVNEAGRLYRRAIGEHYEGDDHFEWPAIRDEMQAVIDATSNRDAGQVIAWWGCWDRTGGTPANTARHIRAVWRAMLKEKGRR